MDRIEFTQGLAEMAALKQKIADNESKIAEAERLDAQIAAAARAHRDTLPLVTLPHGASAAEVAALKAEANGRPVVHAVASSSHRTFENAMHQRGMLVAAGAVVSRGDSAGFLAALSDIANGKAVVV